MSEHPPYPHQQPPHQQVPYQQGPYQQGPHQQGHYQQSPQQGRYQQSPQQAPLAPADERRLAVLAHLIPAILFPLSAGTLGFVGSLVIYVLYKDRGPFVRAHAANSLNVQIIAGILALLSYPLMFLLIGFATLPLVIIWATVLHIIGAVRANEGRWWHPPMTPRLLR